MFPLGRLLRRHREEARLTQEELAERAGVSARTISTTHIECEEQGHKAERDDHHSDELTQMHGGP